MYGPCHSPSSRNARAGSTAPGAADCGSEVKLTSKQARTARSPAVSSSSRCRSSASRRAIVATVQPRRAASRAPAIRIASGSPAHARSTSRTGPGSAVTRSSPMIRVSICSASSSSRTSRSTSRLPGQVRQPVPRCHDHRAGRAARQQRPHLSRVPRVIQHDQHPPVGQPGPVQRRPLIQGGRDPVRLDAQITQQPGQHLIGLGRLLAGPQQAHEQLAVGELPAQRMRRVHGQHGLAQARRADHRRRC